MFQSPYSFYGVGNCHTNQKDPFKRIRYKFRSKHRTYLVTLELYSFHLVAIKYCDVKDKNSKHAYHKIFNDGDASRVIGTCFKIMHDYWRKNRNVNFVFYASLRDIAQHLLDQKTIEESKLSGFIESYKRSRFRIYRYGMVNFFSPDYFTPAADSINCIYVLINKNTEEPSSIMRSLSEFLLKNHDLIFNPHD